ncbi:MAG TPA: YkgJ family cysteine cluster protein [Nitrospirota bacterium]|nr:YkgJ family cysteine cluster protein [Nitrospirota bacterium]
MKKSFYRDGIKFECQGSGKCCITRGKYEYVYISFKDRKRLAAYLGISTDTFTSRYAQKTDGRYHIKNVEKDCFFYQNNRCTVYDARPWQCRTWPFWPENMSRTVWEEEVASYCPGVGKGRMYSAEEIEEILIKRKDVTGCLD